MYTLSHEAACLITKIQHQQRLPLAPGIGVLAASAPLATVADLWTTPHRSKNPSNSGAAAHAASSSASRWVTSERCSCCVLRLKIISTKHENIRK